jgi:hypothetical protein
MARAAYAQVTEIKLAMRMSMLKLLDCREVRRSNALH